MYQLSPPQVRRTALTFGAAVGIGAGIVQSIVIAYLWHATLIFFYFCCVYYSHQPLALDYSVYARKCPHGATHRKSQYGNVDGPVDGSDRWGYHLGHDLC